MKTKKIINKTTKQVQEQVIEFKDEFLTHLLKGLTAAFGFLIALSWRTPIKKSVELLTEKMGLSEQLIFLEYLSAIIITIVAVVAFMLIAKFKSTIKKDE